jgi:pyridoxine 5-phosphate synthase
VEAICAIPELVELNIGHSIVARALFSGLAQAVTDLKQIMRAARSQSCGK